MVINEKIEIKVNNHHLEYYKNLGYENVKYRETLLINPIDLPKGSHVKVLVECDCCGIINEYEFRGIKLLDDNKYNCKKCVNRKEREYSNGAKEKMIEKCKLIVKNKIIEDSDFLIKKDIKTKETKKLKYHNETYNNQEKRKKTCLSKYGTPSHLNINKKKETTLSRYGSETYNNQEKKKKTCLLKYGYEHTNHVDYIFEQIQKSAYKLKRFENTDLYYRGTYELDFLNFCKTNDIIIKNHKSIEYYFEGKSKKYYPDFYHEETNTIIEIKSTYTFKKDYEINLTKEKACLEQGYNFLFIIDKNYIKFQNFLVKK